MDIIFEMLKEVKPQKILDYGCGGGWLSKILISRGYNVTGVDLSENLIENAKQNIPKGKFVACDCLDLPFDDSTFDLIIGFGILHHLDLNKALLECKRVSKTDAKLFFIEPNKFNPLSFVGNKMRVLDEHTEDETPLNPIVYKNMLNGMFKIKKIFYLFPYSFGAAYISGKLNLKHINKLLPIIRISEKIYENIPVLNLTCSQIVVILENKK